LCDDGSDNAKHTVCLSVCLSVSLSLSLSLSLHVCMYVRLETGRLKNEPISSKFSLSREHMEYDRAFWRRVGNYPTHRVAQIKIPQQ